MPDDQTNELREIAFRKIGRNVVNLQRFERMLKLIIVRSNIKGYASELAKVHQARTKEASHKTLGSLVREFLKIVYDTEDPHSSDPADDLNEIWLSHAFRIESNAGLISRRERELQEVVEERNLLIHHLLAEVDFDSVDECQKLISQLDEQNDRLTPHFDWLMQLIGSIQIAQQELAKQLENQLRESLLEGEDSG
jgi:hypothetical protein